MSFFLGVAIFVIALLISVMLHEAGHFVTAKMFGMKVTQFFVGFGQTIWSTKRGETEYGIKAIPAGGFNKIVGMTELEDVDPADEPRSFRRQAAWKRIIVLAAGSFMHFVLALFLLFVVAAGIGLETASSATTVGAIESCVPKNVDPLLCLGRSLVPGQEGGPARWRHDRQCRGHPRAQLDRDGEGHPEPARPGTRSRSWWNGTGSG